QEAAGRTGTRSGSKGLPALRAVAGTGRPPVPPGNQPPTVTDSSQGAGASEGAVAASRAHGVPAAVAIPAAPRLSTETLRVEHDLGVPSVSFNALTGHRSCAPEDCSGLIAIPPQGPVP